MPRRRSLIVCALVPRFALRVAAGMGGSLPDEPVALGPEPGGPPLLGEANAAAAAFGVQAGMRVAEGIARCPRLRLVTPDPGAVADASEMLLSRLEGLGAAVEPLAPGRALFSADGLVRLHGGASRLLAATAMAAGAGARVGAGPGRFVAQAAAVRSRPRRPHLVEEGAATSFLAPMPVGRLAARPGDGLNARGARRPHGRRAGGASPARGRRPLRAPGDRRLAALAGRGRRIRGAAHTAGAAAGVDRVPRAGGRPPRAARGPGRPDRPAARPPSPRRPPAARARGVGAAGCGRLLPAAGGPARADRRPAQAARRPSAPPDGASGSGRRAPARDLGAGRAWRSPARAPPARIGGPARARRRGRPPGHGGPGRGAPVAGGRGGAVVAAARGAPPARPLRRLTRRIRRPKRDANGAAPRLRGRAPDRQHPRPRQPRLSGALPDRGRRVRRPADPRRDEHPDRRGALGPRRARSAARVGCSQRRARSSATTSAT